MKRIVVLAMVICFSLGLSGTVFASSDGKTDSVAGNPAKDVSKAEKKGDQRFDMVAWATVCVTPVGYCPLNVAMWPGAACVCYWANGTWTSGFAQ